MSGDPQFFAGIGAELKGAAESVHPLGTWTEVQARVVPRRRRFLAVRAAVLVLGLGLGVWAGVGLWQGLDHRVAPIVVIDGLHGPGPGQTAGTDPAANPLAGMTFPTGEQIGLWAGNVEVYPPNTRRLPPSFWQKPPDDLPALPQKLVDAMGLGRAAELTAKPLWVFAQDADYQTARDRIREAWADGRPVFVIGATDEDAAWLLDVARNLSGEPPDGGRASERSVSAKQPWNGPDSRAGWEIVPLSTLAQARPETTPTFSAPPSPDETYAALALWTLAEARPPAPLDERVQRAAENGDYLGFWAGNVETIPERSKHLPDLFYTGPTPSTALRVVDGMPVRMDPSLVGKPLWIFGDEVDVPTVTDRIRRAIADDRPVVFYATRPEIVYEATGIRPDGSISSPAPLDRRLVAWLPWINRYSNIEFSAGVDAPPPDLVFMIIAEATVELPPDAHPGPPGPPKQAATNKQVVRLLRERYAGTARVLVLPDQLPFGFVPAATYGRDDILARAIDANPVLDDRWYAVRYTSGRDLDLWVVVDPPRDPDVTGPWVERSDGLLGPVSIAVGRDGLAWAKVATDLARVYVCGDRMVEQQLIQTAARMERVQP